MTDLTLDQASRMRELLTRFKLPTLAAEIIKRLTVTDRRRRDARRTRSCLGGGARAEINEGSS